MHQFSPDCTFASLRLASLIKNRRRFSDAAQAAVPIGVAGDEGMQIASGIAAGTILVPSETTSRRASIRFACLAMRWERYFLAGQDVCCFLLPDSSPQLSNNFLCTKDHD